MWGDISEIQNWSFRQEKVLIQNPGNIITARHYRLLLRYYRNKLNISLIDFRRI